MRQIIDQLFLNIVLHISYLLKMLCCLVDLMVTDVAAKASARSMDSLFFDSIYSALLNGP